MDHSRDISRLRAREPNFKMTPRRRQVLWHIAYHGDLRLKLSMNWAQRRGHAKAYFPFLAGTDVTQMVWLLKRVGLVKFDATPGNQHLHIRPFGMEVLLNGVPEVKRGAE